MNRRRAHYDIFLYTRDNYNLFLEANHNDFKELCFNFSGVELEPILKIIKKLAKCTELRKLLISNISNEYLDKIDFNFLADFKLLDIDISLTFPLYQITHFASDNNCLILLDLQTEPDIKKIILNFKLNTKIIVKTDRLKQAQLIMNNLSMDICNLELHIVANYMAPWFDEFCDFIDNGLNNLPSSLVNLEIYYRQQMLYDKSEKYKKIMLDKLNNIKIPYGCILHIKPF